ncbi:hypothetical protein GGR28_001867 [Lewinella aquimaris]|uniref:Glycosyl hydrolases family 2, sugar binding domain n=1 Tax=Neolewinella aquimaris TaxID=1835722 RepID=A0A840E7L3_9BACT|nr:glycosyl hydrolase [Neolewinella aquimaris]MBB4079247.1 hypothetical protein [Neolewinella aquimaris]
MKLFVRLTCVLFFLVHSAELFAQRNEQGSTGEHTATHGTETFLEDHFAAPPAEARARTWWHWLNGNISREGIRADLEAMKRVGIQEAQIFNVDLGLPFGGVEYLSEAWTALLQFAASEAARLDLELSFHNSAGWSSSGGPWIDAEHAMQTLVHSEITVQGDQQFSAPLPMPETRMDFYRDVAVLAFPKPEGDVTIKGLDYKMLGDRIRNHVLPETKDIAKAAIIDRNEIIDLRAHFTDAGVLDWNVPPGEWIVLRLGHTPTGTMNRPAVRGGQGLECDKMSKKAVERHWEGGVQPIIDALSDYIGRTVKSCLIDSYEVGATNWTSGFEAEFKRLRGYDCLTYLPTLAGYYVGSGEVSERFLWDFRRTIGDLIAENYYARFSELCHQYGLTFSVEPYWGPFDNMQVGATGDIVMCEFWTGGYPFFDSPKFVSSIAHLKGNSIVGAESFTGIGGWDEHPAVLKTIGDKAWAQGITRFIFHSYVHQPWNVAPGLALSYHGTEFNRLNTWWEQGKAYMDYIGRSQFLLQRGKAVADVLVFTGESSPNDALLMPEVKQMGFDYDLLGVNNLYDLRVENGNIVTPAGGSYRVLVLPEQEWMRPETVQKLAELSGRGAKIIGPKPLKSPSLSGYPACDKRVRSIADKLWATRAVQDISIVDFLNGHGGPPDFTVEGEDNDGLTFIHRKTEAAHIYFVANDKRQSKSVSCRFRVTNKTPEIWDAQTGEIMQPAVWNENPDGTTTVPVVLESEQAIFVVFRSVVEDDHITRLSAVAQPAAAEKLPQLEILSAEYGTFLQEGLVDVTDKVADAVVDNELNIRATRHFCDCDPAMGYTKEFRIEYTIGDSLYRLSEMERDSVNIDPGGKGELVIRKAVFGKFLPETRGVPGQFPVHDVSSAIGRKLASGAFDIAVDDRLLEGREAEGRSPELRITYSTAGEVRKVVVPAGGVLKLSDEKPFHKTVRKGKEDILLTPYPLQLTYERGNGISNELIVGSVPNPLALPDSWELSYSQIAQDTHHQTLQRLTSWSTAQDSILRYFSGTASYSTSFEAPPNVVSPDYSLELDLGSVQVIAEVILNGQEVGVLWKPPFRIKLDGYLQSGKNSLAVNVTNLWPNRLIGDARLPADYTMNKNMIEEWPGWLTTPAARPGRRTTLASYLHYHEDSELKPSGLLGPVKVNIYRRVVLD